MSSGNVAQIYINIFTFLESNLHALLFVYYLLVVVSFFLILRSSIKCKNLPSILFFKTRGLIKKTGFVCYAFSVHLSCIEGKNKGKWRHIRYTSDTR